MRNVTYFPPYSQEENIVTNAVLLLFSHVNRLAPNLLQGILNNLTDEELQLGPIFSNQVKGTKSVIDAVISQTPFEIHIETKLGDALNEDQIENHVDSIFAKHAKPHGELRPKITLLGLTKSPLHPEKLKKFRHLAKEKSIYFTATTFLDVLEILEAETKSHAEELNLILADFRTFITERNLVPVSNNRLLINPCGASYEMNVALNLYSDQPNRSKEFCKYLGLYKEKTVSRIGEVEAKLTEDDLVIVETHPLPWKHNQTVELDENQKTRVREALKQLAQGQKDTGISRFYLVDRFVETNFAKTSKHGIFGHRYFTLDSKSTGNPSDELIPDLFHTHTPSLESIAAALGEKTWA